MLQSVTSPLRLPGGPLPLEGEFLGGRLNSYGGLP